jgi:sec-independent protein translocase protein TatC
MIRLWGCWTTWQTCARPSSIRGLAVIAASIIGWFFSKRLLNLLITPIKDHGVYFTAPNEAFLTQLKLSLTMGLFVVAPFILFKFYMFVLPGLHRKESRVITPLLISSTLLFYVGVAFGFFVVIPQVMAFLLSFETDLLSPIISVGNYFGMVNHLCLVFGLVFQLPLIVLVLSSVGLVNPRFLLRGWRAAIVIIAAASAVLTPPDVVSQVMMAGPVILLYLGSVLVAVLVTRRKRNED